MLRASEGRRSTPRPHVLWPVLGSGGECEGGAAAEAGLEPRWVTLAQVLGNKELSGGKTGLAILRARLAEKLRRSWKAQASLSSVAIGTRECDRGP